MKAKNILRSVFATLSFLAVMFFVSIKNTSTGQDKKYELDWDQVQAGRVSRMRNWCRYFGYPTGLTTITVGHTAIIPKKPSLSYCQVSKTSSSAITYRILKGMAESSTKVRTMVDKCEKQEERCNYQIILRSSWNGLGYGNGKHTPFETVLGQIKKTENRVIFVRHPLEKFFSGATAHYQLIGVKKSETMYAEVIDHVLQRVRMNKSTNNHLGRTWDSCEVCRVPYNFVGKKETRDKDLAYLSSKVGLQSLDPMKSHQESEECTAQFRCNPKQSTRDIMNREMAKLNESTKTELCQLFLLDFLLFDYESEWCDFSAQINTFFSQTPPLSIKL